MKKKTSLSAKLIAAFMAAILGSVLICALLTHSKVESVLNSNMQLTLSLIHISEPTRH
mgnify:CR=1 FL=1